jgi:hypothetical protein
LPWPALAELDTTRRPHELLDALARDLDSELAGAPKRDFYATRSRTSPDVRAGRGA